MIISLDTETTGVDLAHSAMPFTVTWCEVGQGPCLVEWDVDPLTRRPEIPPEDVAYIAELLDAADLVYLHNAPFDCRALAKIGVDLPWEKVRDTLPASHLLATNRPHDLTWLCAEYLGENIEPHELLVKEVTQICRAIAKKQFSYWKLADEGMPGMPSVKASSNRDEDKPWKNDMWLPRALANELITNGYAHEQELDSNWLDACRKYACADSEYTLYLGLELERLISERGLWEIYLHRLEVQRAYCEMMQYGVTARGNYTEAVAGEYEQVVAEAKCALHDIASGMGHDLELAKGAALNDNMRDFFYGAVSHRCPKCNYTKRVKHWNNERESGEVDGDLCPKCSARKRDPSRHKMIRSQHRNLGLPVIFSDDTGNATLNAGAMREYIETLDEGPSLDFVTLLADKRSYDTALTYIHAYRRFWVPVAGAPGYYRIHPSLNPCGTDHLRAASNSPNMQNVSGESKEISNRACFGPAPRREWWKADFRSIERRIPVYECGEPKMVEVFEKPDEPPYWGSLYYLTASVLYPDEFWPRAKYQPDDARSFKKDCPVLYKRAKFFDLARQYGCGRKKGDLLARIPDSFDLVEDEFPMFAALQNKYLRDAERTGFVETLPDRTIDPKRGYPILASRTKDGRVLSTTPFNYHVSGTACQCKNVALVRCAEQCRVWQVEGFDAHVALEVHDELLFDLPRGVDMQENLPRVLVLKGLMEAVGSNLVPAMPTPVSLEYCAESWAEGVAV